MSLSVLCSGFLEQLPNQALIMCLKRRQMPKLLLLLGVHACVFVYFNASIQWEWREHKFYKYIPLPYYSAIFYHYLPLRSDSSAGSDDERKWNNVRNDQLIH